MAAWVEDRYARGRRTPSPPHHRVQYPPSHRELYDERDTSDYYGGKPPRRRFSEGAGSQGAGYYSHPDGDRSTASTYRPRYGREHSDLGTHQQQYPTDRLLEGRDPPRQVSNKVWMSDEYKKKQREAGQLKPNSTPSPLDVDKPPTNKQTTGATSKSTVGDTSGSLVKKSIAPMALDGHHDPSAMDIDSKLGGLDHQQQPKEVEANNEAEMHLENLTRFKSDMVSPAYGKQIEISKSDQADKAPVSWLRTKNRVTTSSGTPTSPKSPTSTTEKPAKLQDGPNSSVGEILQQLFSTTVESYESRQELKTAKKILDSNMKDLSFAYGKEDVASKAKSLPHITAMRQKHEYLEGEVSKCDQKGKALANAIAKAVQTSIQQRDTVVPDSLHTELVKLRNDNERLTEKNVKLESRLLSLEVSSRERAADAKSLSDVRTAIEKVNSDMSGLLATKDSVNTRIETCENEIEFVQNGAITTADLDVKKLEAAREKYDSSISEIQQRLEETVELRKILDTMAKEQQKALATNRQEVLEASQSSTTRYMADLEHRVEEIKSHQATLEEKIIFVGQRPEIEAMSQKIALLDSKIKEDEKQYGNTLAQLKNNITSLKSTVADQHTQLNKLWQSSSTTPMASPRTSVPVRPASTAPVQPTGLNQPLLPNQQAASSPTHNVTPQWAATSPHLQGQGINQVVGPPAVPNAIDRSQNSAAQWRYGTISPPVTDQAPALREMIHRIIGLEQFVTSHEQRLNFTTMESCWNPMIQHVMNYIGKHYRLPETLAKDVMNLQNTTNVHSQNLADISRRVTELNTQQQGFQDLSRQVTEMNTHQPQGSMSSALQEQVEEHSSAIQSLKSWTQTALLSEAQVREQLRKDVYDRIAQAIDEFEKSTADLKQQLADIKQTRDPATESSSDLSEQVTELYNELQDLQNFCVEEVSKLHGKDAELNEEIKTHLRGGSAGAATAGSGLAAEEQGAGLPNRGTTSGGSRKRVVESAREQTPQNGKWDTGGSSSESVLNSSRKRRRKLGD